MIASGFGKSPFIYKGSGLYQIHLVKAEAIRHFIPKEVRLDETFGYTLGGFYLGNYEDSSFGAFDELVVIAGTVKSGPSPSCAWTAKVLISNDEVRDYAQKELGVLSHAANFSKKIKAVPHRHERKTRGFLNINGLGNYKWPKNYKHIQITEIKDKGATHHSCNINLKTDGQILPEVTNSVGVADMTLTWPKQLGVSGKVVDVTINDVACSCAAGQPIVTSAVSPETSVSAPDRLDLNRLMTSPRIKLSLPCFSGLTKHIPDQLLEYTCKLETRVRVVGAAKVSNELTSSSESGETSDTIMTRIVLQSKPILAFEFSSMKMLVGSPTVVFQR